MKYYVPSQISRTWIRNIVQTLQNHKINSRVMDGSVVSCVEVISVDTVVLQSIV